MAEGDELKRYRLKELIGIVGERQKIEAFNEDLFLKMVEQIIVLDGKEKVIVKLLEGIVLECDMNG